MLMLARQAVKEHTWTKCATEAKPCCCASKMAMPVGFSPRLVMQILLLQIQSYSMTMPIGPSQHTMPRPRSRAVVYRRKRGIC